MSTETLNVFVDNKINKLTNFYYYQIIRRIAYNKNKETFKDDFFSIFENTNQLILHQKDKYLVDNYLNIYDENKNIIGFIDWIDTVLFNQPLQQ